MAEEKVVKEVPVVRAAREVRSISADGSWEGQLSTGVRAKLTPVSAALIEKVTSKIKDPEIPIQEIPEKGTKEPNPFHPQYLKDMEEAEANRAMAGLDAMVMFGVELLDPIPADGKWLKKLKFLGIDLSEYDLEDDMALEFLYKRFVAVGNDDLVHIGELSGISRQAVEEAKKGSK